MDIQELYQEIILDHSRYPRNFGKPKEGNFVEAEGTNPSCGDSIRVFAQLDPQHQIIETICFEGKGCAICMASASLMTEVAKKKKIEQIKALKENLQGFLTGNEKLKEELPEELACLKGVRHFPIRVKCALLPWHALDKLLTHF
ncbi:Fe-S cluster assembly sulfur transfer protein SufU [Methylacidiphilum caldifontis]|uniref:SUF system NifU family Fe-S cluster assembly protein n=1 Tax=Methylacidiphilum caldifontis TaxID=2795386 RepID=A0A4Y8PFE5_9BACT|nr:SUF system NifU family Fe-S cluster assembly protein [Methylacidiphilum caldifontis]QSR88252.1 SUF system NifU family Fe-S cluster assembly protein [Methylacidiphilum caldifontis]TFE70567.1 SUF system NifU family Fe-S cluster assembly protein [Methylacidiphilum caldifontis]